MQVSGRRFQQVSLGMLPRETTQEDYDASSIVWHMLRIARHAETTLEFDVHRPRGWSWLGFRIMANILVLGDMEPSQLATALEVSRPSVTTAVQRLERDGLIARTVHPGSKARVLISLTGAGRRAAEAVAEPQHRGEVALTSGLDAQEKAQLARLLEKMYDSMPDR